MKNNLKIKRGTLNNEEPPDIFRAAKNDDVAEMEAARRAGQTLQDQDSIIGFTPIHVAAIEGSLRFVEAATKTGEVDPWIRDNNLRLAVDHAAAFNRVEIQKILIASMYVELEPPPENVVGFPSRDL